MARPSQLPPTDWKKYWLILAGRGWGKTRTGAETFAADLLNNDGWRGAIVAPTFSDCRDTCIEGDSGLLNILPQEFIQDWNRSLGELILTNGSRVKLFSGDTPERLRGPQHHVAWVDELAAMRYGEEVLDQLNFGLRLGDNPRVIITTTPKPTSLIKKLSVDQATVVTRGSTFENAENLAQSSLEYFKQKYEGTTLGRQELYAEIIEDVQGALWTMRQLEMCRAKELPKMVRIVVAIDPAVTSNADSDETGIIVAGLGVDGFAYVLEDCSMKGSPDAWAQRAIKAFETHNADRIIAETNQGGDMIERILRTVSPNIPYKSLHAGKGKLSRAEPVAALYEQRRVYHLGFYDKLETQMTTYTPLSGSGSPDRLDALVWAITELMLTGAGQPSIRQL